MKYKRMPIEIESPEQMGYDKIRYNLTESSFSDSKLDELDLNLRELLLCYGDHRGKPELRQLIAAESGVTADEVLLTPGAAGALFILSTALLEKGDRLLVEHPNYATNIETPRAIGAEIDFLPLTFENGFKPTPAALKAALRPDTKVVSLTLPHNPTGRLVTEAELRELIRTVDAAGPRLIVDETYREMTYPKPLPVAASLSPNVISVSSLSKTYGIPGIRLGWLICRDPKLMEILLAAKEQIVITGSIVDEEIAYRFLLGKKKAGADIEKRILRKRQILKDWFRGQKELEWVEPQAGVACFPRIKPELKVDPDLFYTVLAEKYGTYVGPGHWFEMDRGYFRIGYGWPTDEDLLQGLKNVTAAIQDCIQ